MALILTIYLKNYLIGAVMEIEPFGNFEKKIELYKEFYHDCDPYAKKCFCFEPEIDQKSKRNIIIYNMKAKNPTSVHLRIFN